MRRLAFLKTAFYLKRKFAVISKNKIVFSFDCQLKTIFYE